jgi:integrase
MVKTMNLFNEYTQEYIEECKSEHAHSGYISKRSKANNLLKVFGKHNIGDIKHSDIKKWKRKVSKKMANKTINDHFSILRGVFLLALNDGVISINPMEGIETLPVFTREPSPFTKNELIALKNTETNCISEKNLVFFGVVTGLRICELLALTWDCIDFDKGEITVNKAVVLGHYKTPKTKGSLRIIEINEQAADLLKKQFELTGTGRNRVIHVLQLDNKTLIKQSVQFLFLSSIDKKPFKDAKPFNTQFFKYYLQQAGVAHRGVNQLRHTFASQSLTAGLPVEWIRIQMGHTSTQMIEKHYGKWMNTDAPDYSKKLGKALSAVFDSNVIRTNFTKQNASPVTSSWADVSEHKFTSSSCVTYKSVQLEVSRCA